MNTRILSLGVLAAAFVGACGGSDDGGKKSGSQEGAGGDGLIFGAGGDVGTGNSTGSGAATGTGATSGTGSTGPVGAGGATVNDACGVRADQSGCIAESYAGEQIPLDIYIMFDQSCSMSCPAEQTGAGLCCTGGPNPRIDQVRSAVDSFLRAPESVGIGVGIGYFGYMQAGNTSCDPSRYSAPAVPMGALPGNADPVINSLNLAVPTGETPTGAAIRGACTYASQWKKQNLSHKVVILLVTDGFPEAPVTSQTGTCNPSIDDAAAAAAQCLASSAQLSTYVIGVGQRLTELASIAQAGGTGQAYLVDTGDVTASVLQALNQIRAAAAIPCDLSIPPAPAGGTVNYQQINVNFCDGASQSHTFLYVDTLDQCDPAAGGWYYDDPNNPQHIVLCEQSCNTVTVPGGKLSVTMGCKTQSNIR